MSRATVPLEAVVGGLRAEGLLREEQAAEADALIAELRAGQPWYVRAMVAVGAWLASFQVIGFVAAFGIMVGGYVIVGLALIAGAVALRRKYDNDFVVQATLAASLAGQALLAWGIADLGDAESIELLCAVIIVMSGVLFFIFPDRIHRVLSVLFAASALTVNGVALSGALQFEGDQDWFVFTTGAGNVYGISVSGFSQARVTLYDSAGTTALESRTNGTLFRTLDAATTYRLRVDATSAMTLGAYTIAVSD